MLPQMARSGQLEIVDGHPVLLSLVMKRLSQTIRILISAGETPEMREA